MPRVFRASPPFDLVRTILNCFSLTSLSDTTWFSTAQIHLEDLGDVLILLEEYYYPCMRKYLHNPLTPARAITILRQILKEYGVQLTSAERSHQGKKITWYQLAPPLTQPVTLTFD